MGILIAQIYWPIWLVFRHYGYTYTGMAAGVAVTLILLAAWWRFEFGHWKFWK